MKVLRIASLLLAVIVIFSSCKPSDNAVTEISTSYAGITYGEGQDMFSDRDTAVQSTEGGVSITLSGDTATASSDAVLISDGIITLREEAVYVFSGTLDEGMIYVCAEDNAKLGIVLDGVSVTSGTYAPIYIASADKVFITLKGENTLENTGTFTSLDSNNIDGAVFSKADLTFNGSGTLNVSSSSAHGIVCKDDLVFTGGTYNIVSAAHAIDANDSIRFKDSSFTLESGKDGIHCENDDDTSLGFIYIENGDFSVTSSGDGISAGSTLEIRDGNYTVLAGGGSENAEDKTSEDWGNYPGGNMPGGHGGGPGGHGGMGGRPMSLTASPLSEETSSDDASDSIKGIKSSGNMIIHGGTFDIDSADDAVHSNSCVTVNGGTLKLKTGDDGIHADSDLLVSAGTVNVTESYEGLEALNIRVSGGNITVNSSDDGYNAAGGTDLSGTGGVRGGDKFGGPGGMSQGNGSIVISGGITKITASGDGIDANGTLEISGGETYVQGPTYGDTATLDYDVSAVISGGKFMGTGAMGMAQTFSESSQGVITVKTGSGAAGSKITLKDSSGVLLCEFTPTLSYNVIIVSTPETEKGKKYTLTAGEASAEVTAE